jgi:hypothetical protein
MVAASIHTWPGLTRLGDAANVWPPVRHLRPETVPSRVPRRIFYRRAGVLGVAEHDHVDRV